MDSIEELGQRWHLIYQTLSAGARRQIIGSLLEVPPGRSLPLPEAANLPDYRLDPEKLRNNLIHMHLPLMERGEFIEWQKDPFSVKRGPRFDEVASVILAIDEFDDFPEHLLDGCHFHEQNAVEQ